MSTSTAINNENITSGTSVAALNPAFAFVTKSQAEASDKAARTAKGFVELNRTSADAFAQSGKAFTAGSIELMNQMALSSQAAMAETLAGLRSLVVARTPKELFDLQTSLTQASAKWALAQTSRFGSASIALTEKVSAPLVAHAQHLAETFVARKGAQA